MAVISSSVDNILLTDICWGYIFRMQRVVCVWSASPLQRNRILRFLSQRFLYTHKISRPEVLPSSAQKMAIIAHRHCLKWRYTNHLDSLKAFFTGQPMLSSLGWVPPQMLCYTAEGERRYAYFTLWLVFDSWLIFKLSAVFGFATYTVSYAMLERKGYYFIVVNYGFPYFPKS